jgi:PD-(D/E)XK nuclease superfamily
MSENEAGQAERDRKALEAFSVDNPDLEGLKALMGRFNIFEAIGVVRQELRHSDFLAFLLNPQENHDLSDIFVKRLLQRVLISSDRSSTPPVSPMDLDAWNLEQMAVLREWQHIDILLLDEPNRLAVIIENKIGTGEHSDQLRRYYQAVNQHYPGYRALGLYLAPSGEVPSHDAYLPVGYGLICDVIDGLAEGRASIVSPELKVLLIHYTEMLRRHIVGDSKIARLCRQIYQEHQRAIDLIVEHRFSTQESIRDVLLTLIRKTPGLIYEGRWANYPKEEYINFGVQEWEVPTLRVAKGWTRSNHILLFAVCNWPDNISLMLQIGPGDEETRQKLLAMARTNQAVFEDAGSFGGGRWINIFVRSLLTPEFYKDTTDSERDSEIRRRWAEFVEKDLPRIDDVLKREQWI